MQRSHDIARIRAGDSAKDACLGRAVGKALASKAEARCAEQRQEDPNNGGEHSRSAVELCDHVEQLLSVLVQRLNGDDRTQATRLPSGHGGARDCDLPGETPHPGTDHLLPQSMVVRATRPWRGRNVGHHHHSIAHPSPASAKTSMIFSMPQMRTETLGMSSHAARLGVSMA
jgi:hypothetical protein